MDPSPLRLMKDRRYETLPVDRIVVLNSRDREETQFAQNVRSIGEVGLQKPVLVNRRFLPETGTYELVCGEGRLLAHRRLGKTEIAGEVIDCDREEAYLLSLIENIARVPAETLWFGREMKRLKDSGMPLSEISRIVGKPSSQISGIVILVERGEALLLQRVERGEIPITFAVQIARSEGAETQRLLIDAFDQGLIGGVHLRTIQRIIKDRRPEPSSPGTHAPGGTAAPESPYTVEDLRRDIAQTTKEKNSFVRETSLKETRLISLVEGLKHLRSDLPFMELLRSEGLSELPALEGTYAGLSALSESNEVTSHG
jgi:ParB family chromosome partitioning protein